MSARSSTLLEISETSEGFLFSEPGYLKFTPDSKVLFAACQDGIIYKYDVIEPNKLDNMTECSMASLPFDEKISMISVSNSYSYSGSGSGFGFGCLATASEFHELVRLYKIGENGLFDEPKLVTKCVGSTNSIAINPSGSILCCSGQDNIVKVINIKDSEFPVLSQFPMDHIVKSISFSESGNQLALLQADGLLKIFKIIENNPAPQLFKTLSGGPKRNMKGKFQISWKENVLGVLYGGQVLKFFDSSSDEFKIISESEIIFNSNSLSNHFELLSKNCALISSKSDDKISIFSIVKNQIISSVSYKNIEKCSIAALNEKFACIFDSTKSDLFTIKISIDSIDLKDSKMKSYEKKKKLEILKRKNKFIDDSCEDDGEGSEDEEEEGDSEDIEDEGNDHVGVRFSDDEEGESIDNNNGSSDEDIDNNDEFDNNEYNYTPQVIKKHLVVQPCCTPFRNLQRFLAYNNVGFITCRQELDENLFKYDIEFMDRSYHQPVRFEEGISYDLASLCEKGAVFASKGVGAELKYKSFENSEESWNFPLPLETEPILLAVNSHSVYLVNSRGILNIFTSTGLLRSSATCPGRPISLICSESDEIFMFTEDSEGILCHKLDARIGGVIKGSQSSRVLLGSTDKLIWCGLSFSGVLGAFTSSGKFLILLTRGTDRWTEILDTSKSVGMTWPVYFDVNTLSSINCTDNYPDPYPAPIVIDTNFRIPELPIDTFSESYEEILRTNWILNETSSTGLTDREKKKMFASADRNLLELAQISIKSNLLKRLSDLARWASNEKTVELLVQLAKHHKLLSIVDELESIKIELFHHKPASIDKSLNTIPYQSEDIANTTLTGTMKSTTWSTPQLPEMVAKESPSGILANLTPMKVAVTPCSVEEIVSSPMEFAPSPSNPFVKTCKDENSNPVTADNEGNAMLDYISAMMKMNNSNGKRKADDKFCNNNNNSNTGNNSNKKSSLSSNVFTKNN